MPLPPPRWWERALGARVRGLGTGDAMLRHMFRQARGLRDTDEETEEEADEETDEEVPAVRPKLS